MEKDHDLVIRIDENVKSLIAEIKDMKDGTSEQLKDHEVRIRKLEVWGAMAIGGAYAISFLLKFLIH